MWVNTLIERFLQSFIGKTMQFEESPAGTRLPAPAPDHLYLLYLHVPYCVVLCPFCSFHRVEFERPKTEHYFACLRHEIELVTEAGFRFDELYVGGGTPTVLPDELLRTIELVRKRHPVNGVSVETNPNHLRRDNLLKLHDAGVTRLSVGVQSLDDSLLREMQRYDEYGSSTEIQDRLRRMQDIFETFNVDMIFNFPHQTEESLRRDLDLLIDDIGVDQMSFYPLMTVGSTRQKMLQTIGTVDYSRERKFYRIIAERMLSAGYTRTSAWCFSKKPGMFDEYIADREEYLGLGSGAFSYLQGSLFASTFSIDNYLHLVEDGKTGTVCHRKLSTRDQMRYYTLMQLFGGKLDIAAAETRFNGRFQGNFRLELAALRAARAIHRSTETITLTERGQYMWVVLMREFFTSVNSLREQVRHHVFDEIENPYVH